MKNSNLPTDWIRFGHSTEPLELFQTCFCKVLLHVARLVYHLSKERILSILVFAIVKFIEVLFPKIRQSIHRYTLCKNGKRFIKWSAINKTLQSLTWEHESWQVTFAKVWIVFHGNATFIRDVFYAMHVKVIDPLPYQRLRSKALENAKLRPFSHSH